MEIQEKVNKTIQKYELCKHDEKILVALSGGKDSSVTAYLLKKFGYNIEGLHLDLGMGEYSRKCLNAVRELCEKLEIKLHIYDIKKELGASMCYLRTSIQESDGKGLKNCAICGVIKKWILNKKARELNADKIATGHNLDDETQTFLINIFKGSPELSINNSPITKNYSENLDKKNKNKFVLRIKPLFYIPEEKIKNYSKKIKLPVVYEKCPCAIDSYRIQVRDFVKDLTERQKLNIIKNAENIIKSFNVKKSEIKYCEKCGEPSRNNICKMCSLMNLKSKI